MKPTLLSCPSRQMMTRLVLFSLLLLGLGQSTGFAQVLYNYSNASDGSPSSWDANLTPSNVALGSGTTPVVAAAPPCGATQGYGSQGWPTTNVFDVNNFNSEGWYVGFSLTPNMGFGLKITGFSTRSRRVNETGTANDGPIAMRYGYSVDGGATWTTVNPGNPQSSNLCASGGVQRVWPTFVTFNTSNPILFRIYGLSSGANLTGDLFLRDIIVNGEVCENAPDIVLGTIPEHCFSSTATAATLPYTFSDGMEYTLSIPGLSVSVPYTSLPTSPVTFTIPANTPSGDYPGTITVRNDCGFEDPTPANFTITVNPLPTPSIAVEETSGAAEDDAIICNGASATLTASGGVSYIWSTGATTAGILVSPAATATYTVTVTSADGCTASTTQTITVTPITATANAGSDRLTCVDGLILTNGMIGGTATSSTWTANVMGGSFSDVTALSTIYMSPMGYTDPITLTLSTDGVCPASDQMVITYGNLPNLELTVSGPDSATCGDEIVFNVLAASGYAEMLSLQYGVTWNSTQLAYVSHTAASVNGEMPGVEFYPMNPGELLYAWFDANPSFGETLADSTVLLSITFKVINNIGLTSVSISDIPSIFIEATNNQICILTVDAGSANITLNPIDVSCPNDLVACLNTPAFPLSGGIPAGGTFSGTGVTMNTFDPGSAGVGDHMVIYSYTDPNNCTNSCTLTVTVNPIPDASLTISPADICPGGAIEIFFQESVFMPGTEFTVGADVSGQVLGMDTLTFYNVVDGDHIDLVEGTDFNGDLSISQIFVTEPVSGCSSSALNISLNVYDAPEFGFSASTNSDPGGSVDNLNGAASIEVDFCAGNTLTLSAYSDNGAIGYIGSYTTTGNVTYDGGALGAGPVNFSIAPPSAAGFFGNIYGGALGYGLSAGTFGQIVQVFTPFLDTNNNETYEPGTDCLGDPITLTYNIYGPIVVDVVRNDNNLCSGESVNYTISTTSTQNVLFDLTLDENTNVGNPADLNDDNTLPVVLTGLSINYLTSHNFTQAINNALGSFDRGRVTLSISNVRYENTAAACAVTVNNPNPNTQIYPKPSLVDPADKYICSGNSTELDLTLLGLPSANIANAGFPVRVDWTSVATNVTGASAGSIVIYDNAGISPQLYDLAEVLSLTNPMLGGSVTYTITPRAAGPTNGFNADDCLGDPITVTLTLLAPPVPEIEGATCMHLGSTILLSGYDNVLPPANFVFGDWADDGSGNAIVDSFGLVTALDAGNVTIYYTVTDDAGCASTASHTITVLEELLLTSVYTGGPVACGDEFTVSVEASGFCDIGTLDYYFSWDPTLFQFVTATASPIPGGSPDISLLNVNTGQLVYSFFANAAPFAASVPDGTVILTYTLKAIGSAGIYNVPATVELEEAYNGSFSLVETNSEGVSIKIVPISLNIVGNPVACPSELEAVLQFDNVVGNPNYYYIDFVGCPGFTDTQEGDLVIQEGEIVIPFTGNVPGGSCNATLVVSNTVNGCASQTYHFSIIIDQIPPTASNPAPVNVACVSQIPAPNIAVVIDEDDNCPGVLVVAYEPGLSNTVGTGCTGNAMVISRVYSVTDVAGNTTLVTQTITALDDVAPYLENVPTLATCYSSESEAVTAALAHANANKGDNCSGPVDITVVQGSVPTYSGCTVTIPIVLIDACGNLNTFNYSTKIDTENPTITAGPIDDCYDEALPTDPYGIFTFAVQAALAASSVSDDCDAMPALTAEVVAGSTDCDLTIRVTATDDCGKTSSVLYHTRAENDPPNITSDPLALDGDCFDTEQEALDAAIAATVAGDDCGAPGDLQFFASASLGCPAEIMVEVTDFCGNFSIITYTGVYIDFEDPEVDPDPTYTTCYKTLAEAYASLVNAVNPFDNCSSEAELLASETHTATEVGVFEDDCKEYDIEFTFTDHCRNTVSYTFEYIVIDNIAPTADPLPTLTYTCIDDVDVPNTGDVVAEDNCGVEDIIWIADNLPTSCLGTGTRTYRVTDCAGNSVNVVQTIVINDNIAPTWVTSPSNFLDRVIACDDTSSMTNALSLKPIAEDNCGNPVVTLISTVPLSTCAGGYIRTWRAFDDCGNSSTNLFTQVIEIVDQVAPSWVTFPDSLNATVECNNMAGLAAAQALSPVATDNCTGVTLVKTSGQFVAGTSCAQEGTYINTWIATDGCGNSSTAFTQVITITDNTAPTWVTPQGQPYPNGLNLTISCSDLNGYAFANSLAPTATDLCDASVNMYKSTGTFAPGGDCIGEGTFTNTWVATDDCGNSSTVVFTQVITVIDNTPPTFDSSCQLMPLNLFTSQGANCHDSTSLQVGDVIDYQTSWTVAGVLSPSMGSCIGDNCSPLGAIDVEVVSIVDQYVDMVVSGPDTFYCVRQLTVSFELSDDCGNVQPELLVYVYNIIDDTDPQLFCYNRGGGGPVIADCYPSVAAAQAAALEAISPCDNCTDMEDLVITANTVGTCSAAVTVTVADCAGNEDSYTFYTRIDSIAPAMTVSAIQTCYPTVAAAQAAAIAGTTIVDQCDPYENLDIQVVTVGTCPATVTVTATDECGNSRSVAYPGLCIGDSSEVEIITDAMNEMVDCDGWQNDLGVWLANYGGAVATGSGIQWSYAPLDPASVLEMSMPNCTTHTKSVIVTFRATNGCSNFDETTAVFSVQDLIAPTADLIPNTNLTCTNAIPAPNLAIVTGESDNCGGTPTVALFATSDNMATGCAGTPRIVVHQYVVTDQYCNTSIVNHLITVVDNVPPTFTGPSNITINANAACVYDASTGATGDVLDEDDNCTPNGPGLQAFYTDVVNSGVNFQEKYIITRTWQLTDACGNTAIPRIQTITVLDVTNPTITSCPQNITLPGTTIELACGAYFGSQANPGFDDNCDGETISYELSGATQGSGTGFVPGTTVFLEGETTVTYTVTDEVGNTATCSFTVTVNCITISGRIIWEHDGVSGVKSATVSATSTMPVFNGSDLSDTNGNYDISVPSAGTYKLKPAKNINRLNGVTSADASRITSHVDFSDPITNPYKKVCADVNRSGIINTQDATLITQCLAGNPTALAVFNVFWRFTPTDYIMPGTPHQNVPAFPDFKDVTVAAADVLGIDFFGMKIGDVAAPWANPQNLQTPAPLVWMLKDQTLVAGTELELTFAAANFTDLASYQFALDFDPTQLQFIGFQPLNAIQLNLLDNFGAYNANFGELRNVWATSKGTSLADGTPVFRAKFKVLAGGQKLSQVLKLDNSEIECQAFTEALIPAEMKLVFTESVGTSTSLDLNKLQLQLMQNRPNPFVDQTTIGFILPEACEAQIRILDISGRELASYDRKYSAGYHELDFRMENAVSYGVLFCELVTPQGKRTIKMMTAK